MIRLTDILNEVEGLASNAPDGFTTLKDRLKRAMFNWDAAPKQVALTVLTQRGFDKRVYESMKEFEDKKQYVADILEKSTKEEIVNILKNLKYTAKEYTKAITVNNLLKLVPDDTDILNESKNPHTYQVKGVLVTNTEKRAQGDILSDMRSIPGVTIVTPKDYQGGDTPIDNRRYTVQLSVKIDPHPFPTFGKAEIKGIIDQIKRVDGVIIYKPSEIVKRIT